MTPLIEIRETRTFEKWLYGLRDIVARRRILQRIARMESGLLGDVKALGGGLHEVRVDHGPGYRVYFTYRGQAIILLLCGGDKSGQARDIERARMLAVTMED